MSDTTPNHFEVEFFCDQCGAKAEVSSLDDFPSGTSLPCHQCGAPLGSREEVAKQLEEAVKQAEIDRIKRRMKGSGFDFD